MTARIMMVISEGVVAAGRQPSDLSSSSMPAGCIQSGSKLRTNTSRRLTTTPSPATTRRASTDDGGAWTRADGRPSVASRLCRPLIVPVAAGSATAERIQYRA